MALPVLWSGQPLHHLCQSPAKVMMFKSLPAVTSLHWVLCHALHPEQTVCCHVCKCSFWNGLHASIIGSTGRGAIGQHVVTGFATSY